MATKALTQNIGESVDPKLHVDQLLLYCCESTMKKCVKRIRYRHFAHLV